MTETQDSKKPDHKTLPVKLVDRKTNIKYK